MEMRAETLETVEEAGKQRNGVRRFLRLLLLSLACWTLVAAYLTAHYLIYDQDRATPLPLFHYIFWAALGTYPWAFITPFVLLFSDRYPFRRMEWIQSTLRYLVLVAGFTVLQVGVYGVGGWLYAPEGTLWHYTRSQLLHTLPTGLTTWIVLFLLVAYRVKRDEAKAMMLREAQLESRVAEAELEMLRMQLQPHFLFNTLQAATVLVHDDPYAAEDVLIRLSELLRVSLDEMGRQEVSLEEELEFLKLYLGIQKQRFQDRLTVHMDVDAGLMQHLVPSLVLQPLVENALHHGIGQHREPDKVEISAHRKGAFLELEVRNFASNLTPSSFHGHGVGLGNTRARLEQLYGENAMLELRSLEPSGVAATVRIRSGAME